MSAKTPKSRQNCSHKRRKQTQVLTHGRLYAKVLTQTRIQTSNKQESRSTQAKVALHARTRAQTDTKPRKNSPISRRCGDDEARQRCSVRPQRCHRQRPLRADAPGQQGAETWPQRQAPAAGHVRRAARLKQTQRQEQAQRQEQKRRQRQQGLAQPTQRPKPPAPTRPRGAGSSR